jgi:hypothetical protein
MNEQTETMEQPVRDYSAGGMCNLWRFRRGCGTESQW